MTWFLCKWFNEPFPDGSPAPPLSGHTELQQSRRAGLTVPPGGQYHYYRLLKIKIQLDFAFVNVILVSLVKNKLENPYMFINL